MTNTIPDITLYLLVMGVLVAATRLALARPANLLPLPRHDQGTPPGKARITTVATIAAGVLLGASLLALEPVIPDVTAVAMAALAFLFTRTAARSWAARAAAGLGSAVCVTAWAVAASWLTWTIAAAYTALAAITVIRPRTSFWTAAAVATVLAGNDYVQVCLTRATVRAVAAGDPYASLGPHPGHAAGMPGLIGIPAHAALASPYAIMLGVGDVALPGILIVIAGRAGKLAGTLWLHRAAIAGYGSGLAACLTVATTTGVPLPAMAFLVPGTVIAVVVAAWRAHAWPALASARPPDSACTSPSTGGLATSPP